MTIKYTNIFHSGALKNIPSWDFVYENIRSGNPGGHRFGERAAKNFDICRFSGIEKNNSMFNQIGDA
jgi:hypothetical protein